MVVTGVSTISAGVIRPICTNCYDTGCPDYLKELDLSGTKITDETIEYLAGLDYSCCNLNRTAITDAGLRRLLRHEKTPFSFRLNDTSISPELDAAIQTKLNKYEKCIDTFDLRQLLDSNR